jgi:hypothetical protein
MAATSPRTLHSRSALAAPAPAPIACPRCARTCTVIRLTGQEGEALTLHSCHFCEHRWWTRHGDDENTVAAPALQEEYPESARLIGLAEVLEATRVERTARRTLPRPA